MYFFLNQNKESIINGRILSESVILSHKTTCRVGLKVVQASFLWFQIFSFFLVLYQYNINVISVCGNHLQCLNRNLCDVKPLVYGFFLLERKYMY